MSFSDTLQQLLSAWLVACAARHGQWNRTLAFDGHAVNHWEKAGLFGFWKRLSIYDSTVGIGTVSVCSSNWMAPWFMLDGIGGLSIVSHSSLFTGVQKYNQDSVKCATFVGKPQVERTPIHVGNNFYAVRNEIVANGVNISSGCIIGANSLMLGDVSKNIEAFGSICRSLD